MKFRKTLWLMSVTMIGAVLLSSCSSGATEVPTQDPGAIQTQAFNLVLTQSALQLTQTAMANPPATPTNTLIPIPTLGNPTFAPIGGETSTPFTLGTAFPGFTPLASPVPTLGSIATITTQNGCNNGEFVDETAPKDGTQLKPGEGFSKGWTIKNIGTCAWGEGYAFMLNKQYTLKIEDVRGELINIAIKKTEDIIKPGGSQKFSLKLQAPNTPGEYKWYWKLQDDKGNIFGPLVSVIFVVVK